MTNFAFGILDADGLRGSQLAPVPLDAILTRSGRLSWRPAFGGRYPEFRRFDLMSRAVTLATEAAGLDHLDDADRRDCATLLSTSLGCLDADLGFQASLGQDERTASGLFPHTLASTCLSSVAIRHRLHGPTVAWVTAPSDALQGLEHAVDLVESEEARSALLIIGDVLSENNAAKVGLTSQLNIVAVWGDAAPLRALGRAIPMDTSDPVRALARHLDASDSAARDSAARDSAARDSAAQDSATTGTSP